MTTKILQRERALRESWTGLNRVVQRNKECTEELVKKAKEYTQAAIKNPHILVVTGNDTLAKSTRSVLGTFFDSESQVASSASEALDVVTHEHCHLLIVDTNLSDRPGWELVENVRRESLVPLVPIILVSTTPDVDIETMSTRCGANAFLKRPFDASLLKDTIKRLFRIESTGEFSLLAHQ